MPKLHFVGKIIDLQREIGGTSLLIDTFERVYEEASKIYNENPKLKPRIIFLSQLSETRGFLYFRKGLTPEWGGNLFLFNGVYDNHGITEIIKTTNGLYEGRILR